MHMCCFNVLAYYISNIIMKFISGAAHVTINIL